MSVKWLTTLTPCWRSQQLCGHGVSLVNDYADTVWALSMTMPTLLESFEGFSQSLKKQSGKTMYLDVFTHPIAMI